jgi:predicted O-methyltransferase YrrM/HAMP domain-containing protein
MTSFADPVIVLSLVAAATAGAVAAWFAARLVNARLDRIESRMGSVAADLARATSEGARHREAGAAEAAVAATRADVERLSESIASFATRATAQADAVGAVLRQNNRSVGARIDALVDWMARGGGAEERTLLARELEERDFFAETLGEGRIRPLQLPQIFPGIEAESVEIGAIDPDTKHPNQVDMLYVCAIARHRRAQRIFEFGTYLGRTTYHLARGPHVETVYTLDLDPAGPYPKGLKIGRAVKAVHDRDLQGHFYRNTPEAAKVVQLHGDSRTFDYTPYAGQMDLVFVDGGHTYEMVVNDTRHALTVVKPGGVILWHDFAPKGRDVAALAREFARDRTLFWIEDTSLLCYIDGVDATSFDAATPAYSRSLIKPD